MRNSRFESIPLQPGAIVRYERVAQSAGEPLPERFRHFHALAELVLFEEGSGTCFSELGSIPFGPGTAILVPPMAVHDFAFDSGPRRWILVQFDAQVADPEHSLLPKQAAGVALEFRSKVRVCVLLHWLFDLAAAAPLAPDVGLVLRSLLLALKSDFEDVGAQGNNAPNRSGKFRPFLEHAIDRPNYNLSLHEAATLCRLSPTYFSKVFKQTFGCGFSAYQNKSRLQQAARLLATSQEPVSQVGYSLGFHSHAHFSKRFKTMFGVTPNRFQKEQRSRQVEQGFAAEAG